MRQQLPPAIFRVTKGADTGGRVAKKLRVRMAVRRETAEFIVATKSRDLEQDCGTKWSVDGGRLLFSETVSNREATASSYYIYMYGAFRSLETNVRLNTHLYC